MCVTMPLIELRSPQTPPTFRQISVKWSEEYLGFFFVIKGE